MRHEHIGDLENQDIRPLQSCEVSTPCIVEWKGYEIAGQISNPSSGEALVSPVSAVPPEGAKVVVTFQAQSGKIALKAKLTCRVVHTVWEIMEDGQVGSFGVEFQGSPEEVRSKLTPVFRDPAYGVIH